MSKIYVINNGKGLKLDTGYAVPFQDWETGETGTYNLQEPFIIEDLSQTCYSDTCFYSPPMIKETQQGANRTPTLSTTILTSASDVAKIILGQDASYYWACYDNGRISSASSTPYLVNNSSKFSARETKTNIVAIARSLQYTGLSTSQDYSLQFSSYLSGGYNFSWTNPMVYLVDVTGKKVLSASEYYKTSGVTGKTIYYSTTVRPTSTTHVYCMVYVWESATNTLSYSEIPSFQASSSLRTNCYPLTYVYHYDKPFYIMIDGYKMGDSVQISLQTMDQAYEGMPILGSFKVGETSGVYDLQVEGASEEPEEKPQVIIGVQTFNQIQSINEAPILLDTTFNPNVNLLN